jgi:hypothetical protein
MNDLVTKSRALMFRQSKRNNAPAWALTEIAVAEGKQLAKRYKADEELVLASLYLAHTFFSDKLRDRIQKNHEKLSSDFVKKYLNKWGVPKEKQEVILNAIEAHHDKVLGKTKVAEVVKNAECFKFLTLKGALICLHDFGRRGLPYDLAVSEVIRKMQQKLSYLSLPQQKKEGKRNFVKIMKVLNNLDI